MDALVLHPLDVWTVRDGRPFDVGGVVHARSLWPPSPWTMLGAVRTALCEVTGVAGLDYGEANTSDERVKRAIEILGRPDGPPNFGLGPALLAHDTQVLWPLPQDVATFTEQTDNGSIHPARLRIRRRAALGDGRFASSHAERPLVLLPPLPGSGFDHADKSPSLKWLSRTQLAAWLAGQDIPSVPKDEQGWPVKSEPRIGIEIDDASNTVAEGRFYVRSAHSLKAGWTLVVLVPDRGPDAVPWPALDGQHVRLGADGHLARLSWRPPQALWPACETPAPDELATLLFLSPVYPADLRDLSVRGARVAVEAIAGGRPVAIGGWQLRHDGKQQAGPRRMRRYYPPGTVAYVRTQGDLSALHGTSIARDPEEKAAGFGFCMVGKAPAVEE